MKLNKISRWIALLWWPAERCLALPARRLAFFTRVALPAMAASALWPWTGVVGALVGAALMFYFQYATAQHRSKRLNNVLSTLDQAANGQLEARVVVNEHGDDTEIGAAVNHMLDGLQNLVSNLVNASSQVAGAGDQLTLAAQTLVSASE